MAQQGVLAGLKAANTKKAIVAWLRDRGWAVKRLEFAFVRIETRNWNEAAKWRAVGDRGCPEYLCTRSILPGYELAFWAQIGPHPEPDQYESWRKRHRDRGVLFAEFENLTDLESWYSTRWNWVNPVALERLAGMLIPVEY